MIYFCCDQNRRLAVQQHGSLNGIDFLEVLDDSAPQNSPVQQTLLVRCLKPLPAPGDANVLTSDNVSIEGGERITPVRVLWAVRAADATTAELPPDVSNAEKDFYESRPEPSQLLVVRTDVAGDFSMYRLRLVASPAAAVPPAGFDPLLAAIDYSFKVECPSEFDCLPRRICPAEERHEPEINYLAKDFSSFRQLMFDRLAVLQPAWHESHAADIGVTLVELLAYVGDYLSYQQDAVATEAYLETARRRVSVRRHARLMDYFMHNGCNARAWIQLRSDGDDVLIDKGTQMLTRVVGLATRVAPGSKAYDQALRDGAEVFETVQPATLWSSHNEMQFYTWGDGECCLPRKATTATLLGEFPNLKAGDVLMLAEVKDAGTGQPEDADPTRRHAVRLTHVFVSEDPAGGRFLDEPTDDPLPVTEIQWSDGDALPFPLCISARSEDEDAIENVSVAWGNIVLADHGRSITGVSIGSVPEPHLRWAQQDNGQDRCEPRDPELVPARYRPSLPDRPIAHTVPLSSESEFSISLEAQHETELDAHTIPEDVEEAFASRGVAFDSVTHSVQGGGGCWSISDDEQAWVLTKESGRLTFSNVSSSAVQMLHQSPPDALPAVQLAGEFGGVQQNWQPRRDLLASSDDDPHFVAEVENDGTAVLRFGDDQHGKRPEPQTAFTASYRVGNGVAGNVGAKSIAHIVTVVVQITEVMNPLPAEGGTEQESMARVRQDVPEAFRIQQRAVTPADYAEVAERHEGIQRAAASFRWTGSWHTVFVTADRLGGSAVDEPFETELRAHLERFRMAGYDLEVDGPRFVSLEVDMFVCAKRDYFRSHVRRALLEVFHNGLLPDGRRGVFHADNFTFGQTVYLSHFYAAAQAVPGVASVEITKFQRQGDDDPIPLAAGKIELGRLEIARLDNDPSFRERGVFRLTVAGGK